MKPDQIEIGKVYRMAGRRIDRRVVDIVSIPDATARDGVYRMAVIENTGPKIRRWREYLPWFAADAIEEIEA